jgi:hypothetical protein
MSDKFLTALEAICANPDQICEIHFAEDHEYFFRWRSYVMSILRRTREAEASGKYSLFIYPKNSGESPAKLAESCGLVGNSVVMKSFDSGDYREEPFKKLYNLIEDKFLGIDRILDEIAAALPKRADDDIPF